MRTHSTRRTAKSARTRRSLTLLGALIFLVLATIGGYAVAAPRGPTPTLVSGPSGTTSATSARFTFSGARGDTFECSLDGAAFAACTSPKSYSGLRDGAHAFRLRERTRAGQVGDPVARAWTVDTQAPPAPQIAEHPPVVTNTDNARFAYTDAEAGVTYECKIDGVAYQACTNPVSWWSITTYWRRPEGPVTFSVRARDAAGNLSAATSFTWTIDLHAPPAPRIVQKPANPSSSSDATFSFTDAERGVAYECRLDGGAWAGCTSPRTYSGLADGRHAFSVRALDAAGNRGGSADYAWSVSAAAPGVGQDFTVRGGFAGLLAPGVSGPLAVTISNPNGEAIIVTSLTVTIQPGSSKPGCDGPANLQVTQSNASVANPLSVPANGSVTLPAGGVSAPQVLMRDLPTNQDACKGATFTFSYGGSAHS